MCGDIKEELAKQGDPAPLCHGQMQRILSPTSFAFVTKGGNLFNFSPSKGRVTKGNRKPKTITTGDGLGGHRGRRTPLFPGKP